MTEPESWQGEVQIVIGTIELGPCQEWTNSIVLIPGAELRKDKLWMEMVLLLLWLLLYRKWGEKDFFIVQYMQCTLQRECVGKLLRFMSPRCSTNDKVDHTKKHINSIRKEECSCVVEWFGVEPFYSIKSIFPWYEKTLLWDHFLKAWPGRSFVFTLPVFALRWSIILLSG